MYRFFMGSVFERSGGSKELQPHACMLIELAFALASQQQTWTVDAQPVVRIGEVEAAPVYMFSGITGAVRLSDGRIVVADSGASNLRVYDARGRHVSTLGGPGSGPGEFQRLRGLWALG